jgi:hypothetical protein
MIIIYNIINYEKYNIYIAGKTGRGGAKLRLSRGLSADLATPHQPRGFGREANDF